MKLSSNIVIPLASVPFIIGFGLWLTSMYAQGSQNSDRIQEMKQENSERNKEMKQEIRLSNEYRTEVQSQLSGINAKLDILVGDRYYGLGLDSRAPGP